MCGFDKQMAKFIIPKYDKNNIERATLTHEKAASKSLILNKKKNGFLQKMKKPENHLSGF